MPFPYSFPFYFDPIPTAGLLTHQSDASRSPYIKVDLTKTGSDPYSILIDPLYQIDVHLDPYKDTGEFYVNNYDQAWTSIDLNGYSVVYNFGLTVSGTSTSIALPPQKIVEQGFASLEGKAVCLLKSKGKISLLRDDHASIEYWGGGTAKEIVDQILKATLTPFTHCEAYDVVWHGDTGLDGINVFSPSDSFYIGVNTTRFDAVHTLLNMSSSVMRVESDNKIHIRVPITSGTTVAREFSLDSHVYFWLQKNQGLVVPNAVKVTGQNDNAEIIWDSQTGLPYVIVGPLEYTGTATEAADFALWPVYHYVTASGLQSNEEAVNMAEGVLASFKQSQPMGAVEVPVNFYANLHDYIKVTDARAGNKVFYGNIGAIDWHFSPGKYNQVYSFGGYLNKNRSPFTQQFIPKTERIKIDYWHTVTLPKTKLLSGESFIFHTLVIPHYRRFFIGPYMVNTNGLGVPTAGNGWTGGKLLVCTEDMIALPLFPIVFADNFNIKDFGISHVYDSYDVGGTVIHFVVYNDSASTIEGISAMVGYDCMNLIGDLP
jgi:hypothetical protein